VCVGGAAVALGVWAGAVDRRWSLGRDRSGGEGQGSEPVEGAGEVVGPGPAVGEAE
jgi:hypothetical protein